MAYIFLDESGDLGFDPSKKKGSKYFVIAAIFSKNHRSIEKCVKMVFAGLKKKYKVNGVLHAHKEEPVTRKRLLQCLVGKECQAVLIVLNKSRVYTRLQDEKSVLYNYVTNILLDRIISKRIVDTSGATHIVAAQKETNRFLNENFKRYLSHQIKNNHGVEISVKIATPSEEKGLQAADCVSWALFRELETGDDQYAKIIRNVVVEEIFLFGK